MNKSKTRRIENAKKKADKDVERLVRQGQKRGWPLTASDVKRAHKRRLEQLLGVKP